MKKTHLKRARTITKLLENQFQIGRFRFGLDPLFGLFPGLGDLVPTTLSFYIVWIAIGHGLPSNKVLRMIANIAIDYFVGLIPLLGDILDFAIKSNTKNMRILEEHLESIEGILEGEVVE